MDLYEALKAGTSADELLKKFQEELNAAEERITEENEAAAAQEEYEECLADARHDAATYLAEYINLLTHNSECDDSWTGPDEIEETLKSLEETIQSIIELTKVLPKPGGSTDSSQKNERPMVKIKYKPTEDAIIQRFLNELNKF